MDRRMRLTPIKLNVVAPASGKCWNVPILVEKPGAGLSGIEREVSRYREDLF
jgi:hypothetical protein